MREKINISQFSCSDFATIVKRDEIIEGLKDGVAYVKNNACDKLEEYAEHIVIASMKCAMEYVDEDDAERLADAVVSAKYGMNADKLREDKIAELCGVCGSVAPNPVSFLGEAAAEAYKAVKEGLLSYRERQKLRCNFRQICSKMHSKNEKKRAEGEREFAQVVAAMSDMEKIQFMRECIDIIGNSRHIDEVANKVLNRDEKGMKSECRIIVSNDTDKRNQFKIADNHKLFVIIEKNGEQYPVKMNPIATVIYVMNLISRQKDCDNIFEVVDINKNKEAFEEVYLAMLNDKRCDEIKERLKTVLAEGRLKEYYNEIENKLTEIFREIEEDISPFLVNYDTPLAINKENIVLPEQLREMEI